jgi:hypothetical protein
MMAPRPLRPDEQVAGGFLYVTLGGTDYELSVLSMATNRKWIATLRETVKRVIGTTESLDGIEDFIDLLATNSEAEMDLLIAYDALGAEEKATKPALPDREWIDTHATDREVYEGVKRAAAAAFPKGPDLLRIVPDLLPMLMQAVSKGVAAAAIAMASSGSMNGSQPSTAGAPTTSSVTSPTSSSSSGSTKPPSAAKRRRGRTSTAA